MPGSAGTRARRRILKVMPDHSWTIRPATAADAEFLTDMLVEAVNWPPTRNHSRERIMSAPESARYIAEWPRHNELGVIAQSAGQPVGAAWLRFFTSDEPGYGFVSADIPELSIGVASSWRGRGVGRALLRAVASEARSAGIRRISLSVGRGNFAHGLYLAEGYQIAETSDAASDTMIREL